MPCDMRFLYASVTFRSIKMCIRDRCASYDCEKLPESVEDLVRSIYTYFQYSPKDNTNFKHSKNLQKLKDISC